MTQSQPLAILFADVSGSTRLFDLRGDVEARRLIAQVLDALVEVAHRHGGSLVKTIGDEILCTFPSALQGLMAACDMQRRIAQDTGFARESLAIRVGLHYGETLVEAGDIYGDAVNLAARMVALAKREQIVTTAATVKGLTSFGGLRTRSLGQARVAGKLQPIEVVDVVWQQDTSSLTTVQRAIRVDGTDEDRIRLMLRFRGQLIELDERAQPFSLGRHISNHLVIEADWVSRTHASIEFKRGYFMLADRSTNGTFVKIGNEDEFRLHRDEIHLRKSGTFSLGQSAGISGADVVFFQCGE